MEHTNQISGRQKPLRDSNTHLIQLERYMNDLIQSTILLNSYCYEPKTRELFELKSVLKEKFKQLLQENGSLKQELQQKQTDANTLRMGIKAQIKKIEQLHREIKEYCGLSHNDSQFMV